MSKIKKVRYFTKDKLALISDENKKIYDRYLRSNINKNREVEETTFKVYQNNMNHFMVYLAEQWDNIYLCSEDFIDDAIDIMEGYIDFCITTLHNNKKTINNKLSAVSSFYFWAMKRGDIPKHPFDGKLERMKGSQNEEIIASHYLSLEETEIISKHLNENPEGKFDIIDRLIWNIMLDSGNRIGAIANLTLSSLNMEDMYFGEIREKLGYRVEVLFEEDTKSIIEEWLDMRKGMDNLELDAFFITKYAGEWRPMVKATMQNRIKEIGKIIGLTDFRSHCIRKTKGNLVYEQTGDMSLASELLNHRSLDTTRQSYIKKQSKANLRDKIKKATDKKANESK